MDPALRGELEVAADESIEEFLVELALVETDEGPVSTEYVLGMLEMVLIGVLTDEISDEQAREMEGDEEEVIGEIRTIVRRREDDIRTALDQGDAGDLGDGDTQIFEG
jgi:hypothetical protein